MSNQTPLEAVIACLLSHVPGNNLNRTQLVKLVFLVDYESYVMCGETVTGVTYRYDKQGPFAWDIPDAAEKMETVEYKQVPNFFIGAPENIYTLGKPNADAGMKRDMDVICRRVAETFGGLSGKALVEYTHADPFVDRFRGGKIIEFNKLNTEKEDASAIEAACGKPEFYNEIKEAENQLRSMRQA